MFWVVPVAAMAAPELTIGGTCPGSWSINATGLTPGGPVAVIVSTHAGVSVIPSGPCAGTETRIDATAPGFQVYPGFTADANGNFTTGTIWVMAPCNRKIEIIDMSSCQVSNVWDRGNSQCNPPSVFIDSTADITNLAVCETLNDVTVGDAGGGAPDPYATISFPNLVHIDVLGMSRANSVSTISMPKLKRAHQGMSLATVDSLATLNLPLLQKTPIFSLGPNHPMGDFVLPALRSINIFDVHVYGEFRMPLLQTISEVVFHHPDFPMETNPSDITKVIMPSLTYLGGQMESFTYPNLTHVDLGSLQTIGHVWDSYEYIDLLANPVLTNVDVHSLQEVSMFLIRNNPMLCPADGGPNYPVWSTLNWHVQTVGIGNMPGCFEWYYTI